MRYMTPKKCTATPERQTELKALRALLPERYSLGTYYPALLPNGKQGEIAEVWGKGRQSQTIYLHVRWPIMRRLLAYDTKEVLSTWPDYCRLVVNTTTGEVKEK